MLAVVLALVALVCGMALFSMWLLVKHDEKNTRELAEQRAYYDERINDLLNRLAARNLPEYQAYADTSPPEIREFMFDDFGLVSDEVR